MRIVYNIGVVQALLALMFMVVFVSYNIVWGIKDERMATGHKWRVLQVIAGIMLIVVGVFFPRNWESSVLDPHGFVQQTFLGQSISQVSIPQTQIASPTLDAPKYIPPEPVRTTYQPPADKPIVVVVQAPPPQPAQVASVVHVDPWAAFTTTAQSVIAKEVANTGLDSFSQQFAVCCVDATSTTRQISSYGLNSSVVVLTARYTITSINQIDGQTWTKSISVSETVFPEEFQGLDSDTTRVVLANSLRDKLLHDNETLTVFGKYFK